MDVETFQRLGLDRLSERAGRAGAINGRSNMEILDALDTEGDAGFEPCAEALRDDVPQGTVQRVRDWSETAIFPGTVRDFWVYIPAGLDPARPAALAVFQDGAGYLDRDGPVRAPRVLDTMIAAGELPPTVGVFVMPGRPADVPAPTARADGGRPDPRALEQRSVEYDTLSDAYARFLLEDLLPAATREAGVTLTDDPAQRTIVGISSGGICAFTAAWERPDAFGRVLSHCGSFTAIRGGHNYPVLVRHTERKPIRVFMQSGALDADILWGSWPQANQALAASLEFAGYDVRFEFGPGGHNLRHGGAIFADSLRWLHRD